MNGPSSYLFAEEMLEPGKPLDEITLGEVRVCYERAGRRYDELLRRLRRFQE